MDCPLLPIEGRRHIHYRNSTLRPMHIHRGARAAKRETQPDPRNTIRSRFECVILYSSIQRRRNS